MAWKIDQVDEIRIDVTTEGMIEIQQTNPMSNDGDVIIIPPILIPTLIAHLEAAKELAENGPVHGS